MANSSTTAKMVNFARNHIQKKNPPPDLCADTSAARQMSANSSANIDPPTLSVTLGLRCRP